MEWLLSPHPDSSPQNKRLSPQTGYQIGDGKGKSAIDTFNKDGVIPIPEFPGEPGCDPRTSKSKTRQILIMKIPNSYTKMFLPVPFITAGEKIIICILVTI